MPQEFNYFKWAITTCVIVLGVSGIFNFVVDPYNVFPTVKLSGINTSNAGAADRVAFSKTYMVDKADAETIILGTSMLDIGVDPYSQYLPDDHKPAFNLGVPGASMYDLYRYLQHAVSQHKPGLVIMGLEFEAFLTNTNIPESYPPARESFENRLRLNYDGSVNDERFKQVLKDYSAALFSNAAIYDSFKTIMSGNTVWLDQSGLSSGEARFGSEVRNKGHFSVFRDVIQKQIVDRTSMYITRASSAFRAFDDIIQYANRNNIDLIFMITPYHAFQYELWSATGLWGEFEKWKQLVMEDIVELRKSVNINISVWDFAYYNNITTENVPLPSDKTAMKWYWEPIHFKKSLGDVLLKNMFDQNETEDNVRTGVKLTADNLCQHLFNVRKSRVEYESEMTEQIEIFNKIVSAKGIIAGQRRPEDLHQLSCKK